MNLLYDEIGLIVRRNSIVHIFIAAINIQKRVKKYGNTSLIIKSIMVIYERFEIYRIRKVFVPVIKLFLLIIFFLFME